MKPQKTPTLSPDVQAVFKETVKIRRDLHQHPELGYQEVRTSARVAEILEALGLEVKTGVSKTGVVGLLQGEQPGKTILLRADMDALPVQEENETSYASQNPGVMHACGHDGHTSMLLMAAKVLTQRRGRLRGNVKFIFQPAEEGPGGAKPMIEAGVLNDPPVEAALGIHLWNDLLLGQIGVQAGPIMANTDQFEIIIRGKGGHGAKPQAAVDPIVAAAHVITALQTLISRERDPLKAVVLSIGAIQGGEAFNVIPSEVKLLGTVRTLSADLFEAMPGRIKRVVQGTTAALGAEGEVRYTRLYPSTVNDARMAGLVEGVAAKLVGEEGVVRHSATMGGEDMSFFLNEVPGCYFFIGSSNPDRSLDYPHHHPRFDFDEAALGVGIEMLTRTAEAYLNEKS